MWLKVSMKIFWSFHEIHGKYIYLVSCLQIFLFSFFCTIDIFNDRVSYKIFGDDITGFRSTISVDRLERAKRECYGVFSEKSFNVTGNHSPLRHNKYCQCKRFIRELSLMFSPCCSAHVFPSQRLRNLWQYFFNKAYIHTYIYICMW